MKPAKHLFWWINAIGWLLIFIMNIGVRVIALPKINLKRELIDTSILCLVGFCLVVLMRWFFRRIKLMNRSPYLLMRIGLGTILINGLLQTILTLFCVNLFWGTLLTISTQQLLVEFLGNWVTLTLFQGIWVLGYIGIKYLIKNQQNTLEKIQLSSALNEAKLNTLKGQINPHYMFNCLNNIRALMLEDVDKSREMITRLSETLRYALNSGKIDRVSVEQELEMVHHFIELYRIQLEERLNYAQNVDAQLAQVAIPPMILQILVENGIKHGLANLSQGGLLQVNIRKTAENAIFIQVINDYNPKFTQKELKNSTQIGLKNVQERLTLLYGEEAKFKIEKGENKYIVEIELPLETI